MKQGQCPEKCMIMQLLMTSLSFPDLTWLSRPSHSSVLLSSEPLLSPVHLQAQLIAQSIGQAFSMAYQEFLRANGINPKDLSQKDYSDILNSQEMYNDDLIHFSNSENCKEVWGVLEYQSYSDSILY